jgi:hypothetical protein
VNNELEPVANAVEQVRRLLLDYGDTSTAPRLVQLEDRLRNGDKTALVTAVSESTGGMGSLNDRYLCRENGDKIASHEIISVNKRLSEMVKAIELAARSAAHERGIRLTR